MNVEGELVVGGVLSKKFTFDYQGHTSGNFARMQISGTVNIADGGRLYCYGSIIQKIVLISERILFSLHEYNS